MFYQIGLILMLIVVALIISKRLKNHSNDQLIYEDDMTEDELKKLDDEID